MKLHGQDGERGYAMAALLVSLAVMGVLMSVLLPVWRQQAQREKEAELAFRGEQYARAVALYRAKNGNNFPPSLDILVQGKFLRKKYKDPVTKGDFDIIPVAAQGANPQAPTTPGRGAPPQPAPPQPAPPSAPTPAAGQFASGGIMGVRSKSKENSIRIYKGATRYDQWNFVFMSVNRPGGNFPGSTVPGPAGGRGMPGMPGGPGRGNFPGRGGRGTQPSPGRGFDGMMPPPPPPPTFPGGGRGRGPGL
jgi:type II secretory pathway pseudopilin PulG